MPDILAVAKELGVSFAGMLMIFYLMRKQDERHREEIRSLITNHKDEINMIRSQHEERLLRSHERMNGLTVEVLTVIRDNSKAISTLVEIMRVSER